LAAHEAAWVAHQVHTKDREVEVIDIASIFLG